MKTTIEERINNLLAYSKDLRRYGRVNKFYSAVKTYKIKSAKVIIKLPINPLKQYNEESILLICDSIKNEMKQYFRDDNFEVTIYSEVIGKCNYCGQEWDMTENLQPQCCEKAVLDVHRG